MSGCRATLKNLSVNNLGIALERNRDELNAKITQHGVYAHARDLSCSMNSAVATR